MNTDQIPTRGRAPLITGVTLACAGALLSGCLASPTYGTGKTANQQLMEDITGVLAIAPGSASRAPEIAYNPRPELVKPASLEVLPEPQQDVASADNPQWPESPEQRRKRLRDEATANQDNPAYRSPIRVDPAQLTPNPGSAESENPQLVGSQREELRRRAREGNQGSSSSRKFLSEPPLDYRQPAETAAVGELGEDEWKKERRQKRSTGKSSWRDYIPWL